MNFMFENSSVLSIHYYGEWTKLYSFTLYYNYVAKVKTIWNIFWLSSLNFFFDSTKTMPGRSKEKVPSIFWVN